MARGDRDRRTDEEVYRFDLGEAGDIVSRGSWLVLETRAWVTPGARTGIEANTGSAL